MPANLPCLHPPLSKFLPTVTTRTSVREESRLFPAADRRRAVTFCVADTVDSDALDYFETSSLLRKPACSGGGEK